MKYMEKYEAEYAKPKKEEGVSGSTLEKAALLTGAPVAAGAVYENYNDTADQIQGPEYSQTAPESAYAASLTLRAWESIPLEAFAAVDEYKSILGETWNLRSVPGSDSEQDKMQETIAQKHGVSQKDFAQAFEWKLLDANR